MRNFRSKNIPSSFNPPSSSSSKPKPKSSLPLTFNTYNNKILQEINLARTSPSEYAAKLELYSTQLVGKNTVKINETEMHLKEGPDIFDEAIQYLLNISPLEPLIKVDGLDSSADELLSVLTVQEGLNFKEMESSSSIFELEKRLDHYGVFFGEFCELIDYGSADPELVVVNFVLCDGDESRKDRKIVFNPLLRYVGISSGVLPSEKTCSILNFVQYFYKPGEEIPENMLNRYTYQPNNRDRLSHFKQQSAEVYLDKKDKYKDHFEIGNIYDSYHNDNSQQVVKEKKVKKVKEVKKKIKDKITGKEVVVVKKVTTYEDGEEEVETYTI